MRVISLLKVNALEYFFYLLTLFFLPENHQGDSCTQLIYCPFILFRLDLFITFISCSFKIFLSKIDGKIKEGCLVQTCSGKFPMEIFHLICSVDHAFNSHTWKTLHLIWKRMAARTMKYLLHYWTCQYLLQLNAKFIFIQQTFRGRRYHNKSTVEVWYWFPISLIAPEKPRTLLVFKISKDASCLLPNYGY